MNCESLLVLPRSALPLLLHITSDIIPDSFHCGDDNGKNINDSITITQIDGYGGNGTGKNGVSPQFDDVLGDEFKQNIKIHQISAQIDTIVQTESIQCYITLTATRYSPYFHITKQISDSTLYTPLFSSSMIAYNDILLNLYNDCKDITSNICTINYSIPKYIPLDGFSVSHDTNRFLGYLDGPKPCTESADFTALKPNFDTRNYLCQRWRKSLRSSTGNSLVDSSPLPSVLGRLMFSGLYFPNVSNEVNLRGVEYTNPLTFTYDNAQCNDHTAYTCPLTVTSVYSGPPAVVRFALPFGGVLEQAKCSQYMLWSVIDGAILLPGPNAGVSIVPHPSKIGSNESGDLNGFHHCTLFIRKIPFEKFPARIININLYTEYPSVRLSNLLPSSRMSVPEITQPFSIFWFDITSQSDCTNRLVEWCTFTISPRAGYVTDRHQSFSFSTDGIVDVVRAEGDWELSFTSPLDKLNVKATHSQQHTSHSLTPVSAMFGLPLTCNAKTEQRCQPPPGGISSLCTPQCNKDDPNNVNNPCTFCKTSVHLFSIDINNSKLNGELIFKFRKIIWKTFYKNLVYFHTFDKLGFLNGNRIGLNDYSINPSGVITPRTDNYNTVVSYFSPQIGVTYSDCENPQVAVCYSIVSRHDVSVKNFHYYLNQTYIVQEIASIGKLSVYNDTSKSYQEIGATPIPAIADLFGLLDFPVPFSKHLGVDDIITSSGFSVSYRDINTVDEVTGVSKVVQQPYFTGPRLDFYNLIRYDKDGYPTFNADCSDPTAPTCTIDYTMNSFSTAYLSSTTTTQAPFTLIEHYVPNGEYIFDATFTGFDPTKSYFGSTRTPQGSRDYTPKPMLQPITCLGTSMDVDTIVSLVYTPSILDQYGNTVGSISLTLTQGEFPLGAKCQVTLRKKGVLSKSKPIVGAPLALFGQLRSTFKYTNQSHLIHVPGMEYVKMRIAGGNDCVTQTLGEVTCTINCRFYGSEKYPILLLNTTLDTALNHPLILPSRDPYPIYSDVQGTKNGEIIKVQIGEVSIVYINQADWPDSNDNNDNFQTQNDNHNLDENFWEDYYDQNSPTFHAQQATTIPPRSLSITIFPKYSTSVTQAYFSLKSATSSQRGLPPTPFPQFPIRLFDNGLPLPPQLASTTLQIRMPSSLTGIIFQTNSNITTSDETHRVARLEYNFSFKGILSILIDQDFSASFPAVSGTIPTERKLPCYKRIDDNVKNDQWISRVDFDQQVNNPDHNIIAWLYMNSVYYPGKTKLIPVDPTVMTGQICYTYYTVNKSSPFANVLHTITTGIVGMNGYDEFDVYYRVTYPRYISNSQVSPIEKDSSQSTVKNSAQSRHIAVYSIGLTILFALMI
jgi:hypothetical protein